MNSLVERVYAILITTPQRWQQLVSTLPVDLLTRVPATNEWSALDCLRHLLEAEQFNFPVRYRAFLAGQDLVDFDPHERRTDPAIHTPEQLVTAFVSARQASLDLLTHITDADLYRTAQHPRQGTVTLSQMLHTWAAHDLNHTIQAERALIQPFMLGSGPWRHFFQAHEIPM